jgi:hypothetical protein
MSPFDFFLFTTTVIFMKASMAYCLYAVIVFIKDLINDWKQPRVEFHDFNEFEKNGAIYTPCQTNKFGTVWHCEYSDGSIRVIRMHGMAVDTIVNAFNEL